MGFEPIANLIADLQPDGTAVALTVANLKSGTIRDCQIASSTTYMQLSFNVL